MGVKVCKIWIGLDKNMLATPFCPKCQLQPNYTHMTDILGKIESSVDLGNKDTIYNNLVQI